MYACAVHQTFSSQSDAQCAAARTQTRTFIPSPVPVCGTRPGPLGSVPRASNSQQAMWENSHQQVRVKSAAGSRPRCLRLCPLSPSLCGSLLIDSQSMSTFFLDGGVRCSIVTATSPAPPPPPLLKCADELTRSRQIRTCYLKSGGPPRAHKPARPLGGFMLLHNALKEVLRARRKRGCRALHEYLSGWLAAWCLFQRATAPPHPQSPIPNADNLFSWEVQETFCMS